MCGILFQYSRVGKPLDGGAFAAALETMAHRGPDGRRSLMDDGAAVGHGRLAIIDPTARANQPFLDPTGRWAITLNGEIYNFREVRVELAARGQRFQTESDTEVLLTALIHLGVDATLRRIRGMFAFVLYDRQERRFVGVRDHFGQKPFYYVERDGTLACSSDARCFADLGVRLEIDAAACELYLCTNGIIEPEATFFRGVASLPAGHLIEGGPEGWAIRRYFDVLDMVQLERHAAARAADEASASAELEERLRVAVDRHLVSDVPVGVLLSGGIDSSLVYWLARETGAPLTAFTKVSPGIESIPGTVVPALLKRQPCPAHTSIESPAAYLPGLVDFVRSSHAPARWGGGPPMYRLCRMARDEGITVLLGGDGVDEYAAGYITIPPLLAESGGNLECLHELVDARPWGPPALTPRLRAFRDRQLSVKRRLYDGLAHIEDAGERFAEATLLHDVEVFLPSCALVNSDAYSMMASVELRNPFLDIDLVTFMVNQPFARKYDPSAAKLGSKALFRQTARRLIGPEVDVVKEGTRNYSKAVSDRDFWAMDAFHVAKEIPLPGTPSWRQMFKILNLELFWRLFEDGAEPDPQSLMTPLGRRQLVKE